MRPLGPVGLTFASSTPSARASALTEGDACALAKATVADSREDNSRLGGLLVASSAGGGGETSTLGVGAGACVFASETAPEPPSPDNIIKSEPCETRLPTPTLSSLTTPAEGDGTSIVALSDSTVSNGESTATTSPTFTR